LCSTGLQSHLELHKLCMIYTRLPPNQRVKHRVGGAPNLIGGQYNPDGQPPFVDQRLCVRAFRVVFYGPPIRVGDRAVSTNRMFYTRLPKTQWRRRRVKHRFGGGSNFESPTRIGGPSNTTLTQRLRGGSDVSIHPGRGCFGSH
jgi:hypothetical protein